MVGIGEIELAQLVSQEVEKYAGVSPHAKAYAILDPSRQTYAVTAIENAPGKDHDWIIVQAHLEDGFVVIDADNVFDKKLVYALEQAGVPREQIVLAYEGEQIPTQTEQSS
jgi:hypothetical protein